MFWQQAGIGKLDGVFGLEGVEPVKGIEIGGFCPEGRDMVCRIGLVAMWFCKNRCAGSFHARIWLYESLYGIWAL